MFLSVPVIFWVGIDVTASLGMGFLTCLHGKWGKYGLSNFTITLSQCWSLQLKNNVKMDFHLVQDVTHMTATLLKLNRFLLGSIRELLQQKEKVTCATFCSKWKSTFRAHNYFIIIFLYDFSIYSGSLCFIQIQYYSYIYLMLTQKYLVMRFWVELPSLVDPLTHFWLSPTSVI